MFPERNQCKSTPCQHGGTCVDDIGTFRCSCISSYGGKTCNIGKCNGVIEGVQLLEVCIFTFSRLCGPFRKGIYIGQYTRFWYLWHMLKRMRGPRRGIGGPDPSQKNHKDIGFF